MQLGGTVNKLSTLLRDFGFGVGIVWRVHPWLAILTCVLVLIQGLVPVAAMLLMRRIVDVVVAHGQASQLIVLVGLAGGVALLAVICRAISELVQDVQSQLVTDEIAQRIQIHSTEVDIAYYEDSRYFDTLHQAQFEAASRPTAVVSSLIQLVQQVITLAGIAYLIVAYNWILALVLFFVAIPGALFRVRYARRWREILQQLAESDRQTRYLNYLLTDAESAKEVRLFNLGDHLRGLYRSGREHIRAVRIDALRKKAGIDLLLEAIATAVLFWCLFVVAVAALDGRLTPGDLVLYYQAFISGFGALQLTLRSMSSLYEHTLFLERLHDFLSLKPKVVVCPEKIPVPDRLRQSIRFKDVCFSYPSSTGKIPKLNCEKAQNGIPVLQKVDLTVEAGQVVALVGPNGCGKSTLVKLLCRFYDPDAGTILVDGVDLCHLDPTKWQAKIGVLFQDFMRYFFTVEENIRVGNIGGSPSHSEVEAAAKAAGVHATVTAMPDGYDTMLGNQFSGGHEISGGEWQRIAVARAFLRDAELLVLDEPSSALDALAEAELFRKFRELVQGKSAVLISHRFSTVQMADYIYVMDQGRIVEHGTHVQLLAANGMYANMYNTQASSYQDCKADSSQARNDIGENRHLGE